MTAKERAEAYVREKCPELGLEHRGRMKNDEIEFIGHPIQLQHWLIVLGQAETLAKITVNHDADELVIFSPDITFNLTTGQPAIEADYRAFLDIVGK